MDQGEGQPASASLSQETALPPKEGTAEGSCVAVGHESQEQQV